jgi:hypothetical protein
MSVPGNFVVGRSSTAAVVVQHVTAYPMGFEFEVVARYQSSSDIMDPTGGIWDPLHGLGGLRGRPGVSDEALSSELILLSIEYSDGGRVSNLEPGHEARLPSRRDALVLHATSGGAGNSIAYQLYWLRPLPPAGSVTFSCEWPKYGIPRSTHSLEAQMILDASARAVELWSEL